MISFLLICICLPGLTLATDCPDGWLAFKGSCYLFGSNNVHRSGVNKDYWIGMTDELVEGIWRWYGNGTVVQYLDWNPGEPQDAFSGEDCAMFGHQLHFRWADVSCTTSRVALCELRVGPQTEVIG